MCHIYKQFYNEQYNKKYSLKIKYFERIRNLEDDEFNSFIINIIDRYNSTNKTRLLELITYFIIEFTHCYDSFEQCRGDSYYKYKGWLLLINDEDGTVINLSNKNNDLKWIANSLYR